MMIPVTKSFLPPIEDLFLHIKRAYANEWLTNRGELVKDLESKLSNYLDLKETQLLITNNGTIPLQIALKVLGKGGEIITTPFSYVATTASIVWENCTPVFVDIHPEYFTIDETQIEAAITERTTCILATHVFGNPCHIEALEAIGKKHNLHIIYDAAHCFGVKYLGESVFTFGDISTCSFHATKIFHTGEGGAIFTSNPKLFKVLYASHNFGHQGPEAFHGLGINAKISELQAAMGLSVFPFMDQILSERKKIVSVYDDLLENTSVRRIKIREKTDWNYSYYPIIFDSEPELLKFQKIMNDLQIFPRRYFYPSLNKLPYLNNVSMPVSESISSRILCLPLYYGMKEEIQILICKHLKISTNEWTPVQIING
jgi:dTDP-4-amino-4,6-dideoxygalactose transaminase